MSVIGAMESCSRNVQSGWWFEIERVAYVLHLQRNVQMMIHLLYEIDSYCTMLVVPT